MTPEAVARTQRDAVAFLSSPQSYHPRPPTVERIDTHGAHVFLAGDEVFKIKRAIQYPYMDFSTLEKRRAACLREIEVNSDNAPSIYKAVVAITRDAKGVLNFDGAGEVVEWAVRMVRFCEDDVLANRVARAPLNDSEAKALADAVFASHARAAVQREPSDRTAMGSIAADVLAALPSLFEREDRRLISDLDARLIDRIGRLGSLLQRRVRDGHVRRCHGDLHLGNIVMLDGRPTLFDAIEFDEDLATIDTLYDLAFLLMDLDKRRHRSSANLILNRYLWRSRDPSDLDALAALPVFLSLRAAIRAMVGAQKAALSGEPVAAARDYVELSLSYLEGEPPTLILVGGLSGSGKSTLAAALAPLVGRSPGALHLRSDLERKALFNLEEFDRLPAEAYSERATDDVYAIMMRKAEAALRAGHSVIADAVHAQPSERDAMAGLAHRTGSKLTAFWLEAPPNVLLARVAGRQKDASDATPQVVEKQMTYDLGELSWTRIDAGGPPERTLGSALSHLHASTGPP